MRSVESIRTPFLLYCLFCSRSSLIFLAGVFFFFFTQLGKKKVNNKRVMNETSWRSVCIVLLRRPTAGNGLMLVRCLLLGAEKGGY